MKNIIFLLSVIRPYFFEQVGILNTFSMVTLGDTDKK